MPGQLHIPKADRTFWLYLAIFSVIITGVFLPRETGRMRFLETRVLLAIVVSLRKDKFPRESQWLELLQPDLLYLEFVVDLSIMLSL